VRLLEVSSPQEARWKPFVKGMAASKVVQRFMPLVSLGEMQHMRDNRLRNPLFMVQMNSGNSFLFSTAYQLV